MTTRLSGLLAALAALGSACIYEDADRCGPDMFYDGDADACFCVENAITSAAGCQPCAADEIVVANACACPAGQIKNADNVCATVAGLGDACSDTEPCGDATYSICAPATGGATAGTCTNACASDADCGGTYTCATWEAAPYCREFSGVGASCGTHDDCAPFDAKACDTQFTHVCFVAGCSLDSNDCPRDTTCCDLTAYGIGTLCMESCP